MGRVGALTLAGLPAAGVATAADPDQEPLFRVQRLTERAVVLTEISLWESKHVVIVTATGLIQVDPGHTPLMGCRPPEA